MVPTPVRSLCSVPRSRTVLRSSWYCLISSTQEKAERLCGRKLARLVALEEDARRTRADERDLFALDPQHRPLAQADDADARIRVDELGEALVARLAPVAGERRVRVVRVDLEGDEAERAQSGRLDNRHVVRRLNRRAGDVRAGAPADVGRAPFDARPDGLDRARLVQPAQQVESVSAADGDGLGARDRARRVRSLVQRLDLVAHRAEARAHARRVLVVSPDDRRERDEEDAPDARAEEVSDGPLRELGRLVADQFRAVAEQEQPFVRHQIFNPREAVDINTRRREREQPAGALDRFATVAAGENLFRAEVKGGRYGLKAVRAPRPCARG